MRLAITPLHQSACFQAITLPGSGTSNHMAVLIDSDPDSIIPPSSSVLAAGSGSTTRVPPERNQVRATTGTCGGRALRALGTASTSLASTRRAPFALGESVATMLLPAGGESHRFCSVLDVDRVVLDQSMRPILGTSCP